MKREPRKLPTSSSGSLTREGRSWVAQVAATDAMVNMDTLGLAPTEVWASHADKQLTGVLVYIAKQLKRPLPV